MKKRKKEPERRKMDSERDNKRTRGEVVVKQKEGVRESRVSRVGMRRVEEREEGGRLCEAGNTEQRPGGCLDRCRLPLGSPRSSINRPPHNPALPTVGEICPETHGVVLADRVKEGGNEGVGGGRQGRMVNFVGRPEEL
ncbi:hypothetical protein PAMP_018437 [Pampus punctatissimus]